MRKWVLLLLVLVACAPVETGPEPAVAPLGAQDTTIATSEQVTSPAQQAEQRRRTAQPEPEVPPAPIETIAYEIDPYSRLGCEQLLTGEQFASNCGKSASDLVVTSKIGTRNCFVNVKDRLNERLTAGITLTGYASSAEALTEFERRLKIFQVGADDSVGERAYVFPKVDRQTIHFVRNEFIVEVGSDTRLCPEENLVSIAKIVDAHIK